MKSYLIKNAQIVNENKIYVQDVLIKNGKIEKIDSSIEVNFEVEEIDASGLHLLPGIIDDQVHFREPGLTHKANIYSESKAAVAGGITSFMEMPNTVPPCFTIDLLEEKYLLAKNTSLANYSFYMGTSNENYDEIMKVNAKKNEICGVKIFMGSSTGNLLVDSPLLINKIFAGSEVLIATHCEDEAIIKANLEKLTSNKTVFNASTHPLLRDAEACFESSLKAIQFAHKNGTRLHVLHISTANEINLFGNFLPLKDKKITSEVCVHHLHFTSEDYETLGYKIKCNPAIKTPNNKEALWKALLDDKLDVIATDHAPHLLKEKGYNSDGSINNSASYYDAHAGLPLIQHSLQLILNYVKEGKISMEKVVEKMCHNVAICFQIKERGFIREGYFADLVLVNLNITQKVSKENILYKCGWSPFEGNTFSSTIEKTFVNGHLVYGNSEFDESKKGMRLSFDRN